MLKYQLTYFYNTLIIEVLNSVLLYVPLLSL
jgi:hypothetical protein